LFTSIADSMKLSATKNVSCCSDIAESCPLILPIIRLRAREAREAERRLVKESAQSCDLADVLMREAETALAALRQTMRRTVS
jgi:hypothetical protein